MYGEILKNLRIEKSLTQQQLAEILGFKSASAIGMVEREEREPSFETIIRISDYFNVSSDYLIGLAPFKNTSEAYHSISIASVKYIQNHPVEVPASFDTHAFWGYACDNNLPEELLAYCDHLLLKYDNKLPLTDLELYELSNILFFTVKWSPDFDGVVCFQDFGERTFSIKLDFNKIDKITLDLSKSILINYSSINDTLVEYTSVLYSSPKIFKASEGSANKSQHMKNDVSHDPDNINKRIKKIELIEDFVEPEQALKFILSQTVLAAYGSYDLKNTSDEELIEIANDMLFAMRLSLEKLKKKSKNT